MKNSSINIIILLIIVLLLPGVLFSTYEFSSLKRNEQIILSIYNDQLETIINSINQYSDDIMGSWAEEINRYLYADDRDGKFADFLSLNYQAKSIILFDSITTEFSIKHAEINPNPEINKDTITSFVRRNPEIIKKLQNYYKTGYRKIESLPFSNNQKINVLLFAVKTPGKDVRICALLVDAEQFIRDILGPRMQILTKDQVIIAAYKERNQQEVYSSETLPEKGNPEIIKPLWLFPDYNLGIITKGETIKELVHRRSRMNIIMTMIIDIILLIAIFYIYRNIKKEMQLVQLKSEFISNVSHEIRTPLSLINMYIETLEMNRVKNDDKRMEYYKIISQETKRLSGIVNNILNFSRIDSGKKTYKKEVANLNEITSNVLDNYKYHLHNEGFSYTFVPHEKVPDIYIDTEAISDAIINLLENAVKYSNENKQIKLKTGIHDDKVFLDVKDHGIGIPANEQKLIFDKFYRITEGALAYKAKGTGLGLSIVKHIMNAHNGDVNVESEVNKGSTFRLTFPIRNKYI